MNIYGLKRLSRQTQFIKKITVTFPKWELLLFKAEGTYSIPMFLKTF